MNTVPPSASISPAAILSKVDLPEPLRPTRHRRSPAPTLSSAPSSRRWPPNSTVMSFRCKSGVMRRYVRRKANLIKGNLSGAVRNHGARARDHLQRGLGAFGEGRAIEIEHADIAFHRA